MLSSICYFFIYVFESLACYLFFENLYQRKTNKKLCFLAYFISFFIQYIFSFYGKPYLNIALFVLCYTLISLICYKAISGVFISLVLSALMLVTEMIVVHFTTLLFGIDFSLYQNNIVIIISQAALSKLLFFVIIFIISKIIRNLYSKQYVNKSTIQLGVLPLSSIVILITILNIGIDFGISEVYHKALAICSVFLLFSNIFVFYIWERVQKANIEITQLQLEKQRGEISKEYYETLSREYNNQRILVHDIKNHFQSISDLAASGETEEISSYISSLSENFGINTTINYSENRMLNAILNRYVNSCNNKGIKFDIEACCSSLSFISDSDIVALFDNLLDNAVEAAIKSKKKEILLSIYIRNANFVVVKVINSCDKRPESQSEKLLSSKKDSFSHGIGTQSIKRVVENYNGTFSWEFDSEEKEFIAKAIFMLSDLDN